VVTTAELRTNPAILVHANLSHNQVIAKGSLFTQCLENCGIDAQ